MHHRIHKIILIITFGFYLLVVSGCGNKGDLYLPEKGSINGSEVNKTKKKS